MEKMLSLKGIISSDADKVSGQATVYLMQEDSQTLLPMSIDLSSAEAISLADRNLALPRPHTHDLLKRVIHSLQGKLIDVVIYDIHEDIFYSYLRLLTNKAELLEIDARPSDAIAMALRFSVPILAREEVLLKGGIKVNEMALNFDQS